MSRIGRFAATFLPAALAGGLVFGSTFGHASDDDEALEVERIDGVESDDDDADSARRAPGRRTADADRVRRVPPLPPAPPAPPAPPGSPVPPGIWSQPRPGSPVPAGGWSQPPPMHGQGGPDGRFSISVRKGKVQIEGLEVFARHHLEALRQMIRNNPNIPPDVRDRVLARLDTARSIVERRLRSLRTTDLDKIGDEMERMGEELERAMEGLDEELEKLGDRLGKDLAAKLGKDLARGLRPSIRIDGDDDRDRDRDRRRHRRGRDDDDRDDDDRDDDDDDDHDAAVVIPDVDVDIDVDTRGALSDLPDLTLKPAQREQIVKLRTSYEKEIAVARKQLDDASKRLEVALADPRIGDLEIAKYIDQVSSHEAAIRKARLLTWVNARRVLDEAQRKKIEDAAGKRRR